MHEFLDCTGLCDICPWHTWKVLAVAGEVSRHRQDFPGNDPSLRIATMETLGSEVLLPGPLPRTEWTPFPLSPPCRGHRPHIFRLDSPFGGRHCTSPPELGGHHNPGIMVFRTSPKFGAACIGTPTPSAAFRSHGTVHVPGGGPCWGHLNT